MGGDVGGEGWDSNNTVLVWAIANNSQIFITKVSFFLLLKVHCGSAGGSWEGGGSASHYSHLGIQAGGDSTIWILLVTGVVQREINN